MNTYLLKHWLILPSCLYLLFTPINTWSKSLKAGYFNLVPHIEESTNDTPATGPAISYLQEVMKKSGVSKLNIPAKPYPLSRLLHALESGKIDIAVALGKSPERAKKFSYPSKAFLLMQPSFMVLRTSHYSYFHSVQDILLMNIGIYKKGFLSPLMRDKRLTTKSLSGNNVIFRNYKIMKRQRLDAVYSPDSYELIYTARVYDFYNDIKIIPLPEPKVGLYTVFSKKIDSKYIKNYEQVLSNAEPYESYLRAYINRKF
ncbi:substrate-binding periplasmic protein [Spartinivicinus ruber]|uniref:substrate-binding periplasmic protein n=1 Tax=Spartinivicinus ruber TaxID=2683272 RepID=UPI0013D07CA6|nr:transporter substrate-binding domain-containing protein [Spartinivicinus ruber]